MEILKQIEAKNKVNSVIKSCCNQLQLVTAENMVNLYFNKFEDLVGTSEMRSKINELKTQI